MQPPVLLRDRAGNRWGVFYGNTGQWVKHEWYARWLFKRMTKRHEGRGE